MLTRDLSQSVVEDHHVAFDHARAEGNILTVAPDLRADRLAGKHRGREAQLHALAFLRIVATAQLDEGATGARSGSRCGSGVGPAGPPKPPSPRMKVVEFKVAIGSPFALSVRVRSENISAPLPAPLSTMSLIVVRPITVPEGGNARCRVR